ncbi:aspartate carbamoyltransferase [archaeon]|jgi:aspartate carbamoyltransferase catalytic subunit|nr:aspartate carbamoyltransferase [archaeon]MBT6182315.1 aspartate carbamoyltransferase [archaeon]MBT6606661.1 aspartate carbamoyltransferase [archaeon]MBT7251904.1 aspartate carbamoyltransferase [archaeon]MBT7660588.1 aspartate carbamoyltransferase [archaeon]
MGSHLIESQQISKELLLSFFKRADKLRENQEETLKGKILTSLFYEPSTRTRLSFESAMNRLGGSVMGTENANEFSSVSKGESLIDTIRIIAGYSDVIVMRTKEEGQARKASKVSSVPIINAGDGKGQHPTQTILDMYTIYREIKHLDNLKIAMVGDLASGRTIRSLCYLLGKFEGIQITFVSPPNLRIEEDIKEYLEKHNVIFREEENLEEVLPICDIIYMTRIQQERISLEDYEKAKGRFIIDEFNIHLIRQDARVLHPLPHVEEIDLSLETENSDPRIAYFRQAENGLYARMAILEWAINGSKKNYENQS